MSNPYPNKLTRFEKGNKAATVNKGTQKQKTIIKNKIKNWGQAEKIVEKNILEALQSKNTKNRMYATRYFAEFVKPKKREQSGEVKETITVNINYSHVEKPIT